MLVQRLLHLGMFVAAQPDQVLVEIVEPAVVEVQLRLRQLDLLRGVLLVGGLEPRGGEGDYVLFLCFDRFLQRRYLLRNRQRFAFEWSRIGSCLPKRGFKGLVDGMVGDSERLTAFCCS